MIRNESEYQEASARLAEERKRLAGHRAMEGRWTQR